MGGLISVINVPTQALQDGESTFLSMWYVFTGQLDKAWEINMDNNAIKDWQNRFGKVWDAYFGVLVCLFGTGLMLGAGWGVGKIFGNFGVYAGKQ